MRFAIIGALHTRLVVGFVVDTRSNRAPASTFKNGIRQEPIVTIDDRPGVWCGARWARRSRYNASVQVFDVDGGRSQVVWIADFLPDEAHPMVARMIGEGMSAMKATLDAQGGAKPLAFSSRLQRHRIGTGRKPQLPDASFAARQIASATSTSVVTAAGREGAKIGCANGAYLGISPSCASPIAVSAWSGRNWLDQFDPHRRTRARGRATR
jgi:hypothetical protein